jgi:hypothetical protein
MTVEQALLRPTRAGVLTLSGWGLSFAFTGAGYWWPMDSALADARARSSAQAHRSNGSL